MVNSRQTPKFVDLFCGAGGLSDGCRQAGWVPVAGNDIDPDAMASYAANFPGTEQICGDLRERAVKRRVMAAAANADVLAGGPPCQAFSQVRNHSRLIDDPRNALYREFVDVLRKASPKAFVMENVPGLAQVGVLGQVTEDLGCRGAYRVEASLVDAADFGVPQSRTRIIFLGLHRDLDVEVPTLCGSGISSAVRLRRENGKSVRYKAYADEDRHAAGLWRRLADPWDEGAVTASQAIGDLQCLSPGNGRYDQPLASEQLEEPQSAFQKAMRDGSGSFITNTGVPRINNDTRIRLRAIPPGGNYLDLRDDLRERYITGQLWGPHNGTSRLSRRHYYAYRRLHPDIWSWTLNTKADSVYHWADHRGLSVREFARLQSFSDRFLFAVDSRRGPLPGRIEGGPGHSCYRQVGNAVPPLLARAIAEAVAEALH